MTPRLLADHGSTARRFRGGIVVRDGLLTRPFRLVEKDRRRIAGWEEDGRLVDQTVESSAPFLR